MKNNEHGHQIQYAITSFKTRHAENHYFQFGWILIEDPEKDTQVNK